MAFSENRYPLFGTMRRQQKTGRRKFLGRARVSPAF
jgi:hypothetical protein